MIPIQDKDFSWAKGLLVFWGNNHCFGIGVYLKFLKINLDNVFVHIYGITFSYLLTEEWTGRPFKRSSNINFIIILLIIQ